MGLMSGRRRRGELGKKPAEAPKPAEEKKVEKPKKPKAKKAEAEEPKENVDGSDGQGKA